MLGFILVFKLFALIFGNNMVYQTWAEQEKDMQFIVVCNFCILDILHLNYISLVII